MAPVLVRKGPVMNNTHPPSHAGKRFRKVSLRTLLIAVTLISVVLILVALEMNGMRQRIMAIAEVQKFSGIITYDDYGYVTNIAFSRAHEITDTDLGDLIPHLEKFPKLSWLEIQSSRISDTGLPRLTRLQSLEHLFITGAPVTDAGISSLSEMPNLQSLTFQGERLTDDSLATLARLPKLEMIGLSSPVITDHGLAHLASLRNLEQLDLTGTNVTEAGLKELGALLPNRFIVLDSTGPGAKAY